MKLHGAWRRDYSEFFDTQEALLIDAMDNADSIYTVFARLQSLAVKCGCAGKLLLHESIPYTEEMLAAVTKKTVPAFRQCMQPLVQLGLVICEDGIYAIADWEFNQNASAIDAMREGNRVRKTKERERKNPSGKSASQKKREVFRAYLEAHPGASTSEIRRETGLGRATIVKYRKELALPSGAESVQDCSDSGVQLNNQAVQLNGKLNTNLNTNLNTHLNTLPQEETAGSNTVSVIKGGVQNMSRPKNIDDRYKNTSTSTAVADGGGVTGSGIPIREEVRSHFAEMGFAVDSDRFFDVNEGRGWRTTTGKPVDDWKKLAAVWDRNEHPKAATPPARTEPKADAVGKIPSVEEVMAKWGCDRETAQGYIDENMY